ncbi:MAG TPA: YCF48-related protein [Bryobacteraceae bacterium]|nr:YCF48-related protein [Bryobacteraceae bacterium]
MHMKYSVRGSFLLLLAAALLASPVMAQRRGAGGGAPPQDLQFRFMGPAVGNRISAAVGIPGDPTTYYAGAASGGVWKSTDSGRTWAPVFDAQSAQAIGALALSVTDPRQVWAGTGEAWAIRDSDMMGDGVYKSTDAGHTWTNMGLRETGRIGRIIVHPTNPDIVYVCAAGRLSGPQQERGVFKTADGGKTWQRSLFVDPNTGCSGLSMDASDPNTLIAGTWEVVMHTYAMLSGGAGSGVFVTHDGGANWKRIEGHGLPKSPVGKIDVAIAARNSKRVYALIQTADQGSVWRSDDGGENWAVVNWQRALIGRAGYYIRINVNPANPDEVLVADSSFWLSTDAGKSFRSVGWGGDTHDIWMDPDGKRILVTHDGGMFMTTDHGTSSNRVTLPIGQIYHVAVDQDVPYHIYGNMQDDGTMRGLSTTQEAGPNVPGQGGGGGRGGFGGGRGGAPGVGTWEHNLGGCESGFTIPDLTDTSVVWASCYGNEVTRHDVKTNLTRSVSPWLHTLDSAPNQAKYRCHWTAPLAIDPFEHTTVYYGCQMVLRTTNGGVSWTELSPDLSTKDPSRIIPSGGIVGDNLGQFYGEVVFSIAPSEKQPGLIWAGTNDGKVWYTDDAGKKWNDVTANIKGLPAWGVVSKIEPSHFDASTAYICVDFHLMDNRDPWVYKTSDMGRTWTRINSNLPTGPLAYARVIAENPNQKGNLFVGTGNALYYSLNDGGSWKPLQTGLPHAPVSWVVVQKQFHDLVLSTYGRGFYIMEDITPLEQGILDQPAATSADVKLVAPRPAYRMVRGGRALLSYWLKAAPKGPVTIEILDSGGTVVSKLPNGTGRAGLNRVSWDMHYEPPRAVALRTTPDENPHIWEEPRFMNVDSRPITHWGLAQAEVGPIAAPGKYTVKLTVDGQSYTQPLEILRTPDSHGSDTDLQSSVRLQLKVRDDISTVSDMTNQIEWMRKQLEDQQKTIQGRGELLKALDGINQKLKDVEYKLITRADALSDDKYFQTAYNLYQNFIWLNGEIGTGAGDVAGSGDYGPTETAIGLVFDLERQLKAVQEEYKGVMEKDVPAFNRQIQGSGLAPLETTGAPPPPPRTAGRGGGQ